MMSRPMSRKRSNGLCGCDESYAKSLQGICKVMAMLMGLLVVIIIGASPYWRPLFVLEAITWPFHVVMLFTTLIFLATLVMYALFLSGQHLEYPHIAWPTVELVFNLVASLVVLIAGIIEADNVWRWDMSRGFYQRNPSSPSSSGSLLAVGSYQGGSLTNQINLNGYCGRYPTDCMDYFSLLTGRSSYYGNHIFATILLFILLITYLVSSFFALRTWRRFKRDMSNDAGKAEPSAWDRFRFRVGNLKMPNVTAADVRGRLGKIFTRNRNEEEGTLSVEDGEVVGDWRRDGDLYVEMKENAHGSSVYSDSRKSHHSSKHHHNSHSSGSRRRHDEEERSHYDDDKRSYHDNEKRSHHGSEKRSHHGSDRHGNRSPRSNVSSRSSNHKGRERSHQEPKTAEVMDAKTISSLPGEQGPVASVMC